MANRDGREVLRGAEEHTVDLIAEVLTSAEWAELLRAPLELAVARGDRGLAQKLVGAGAAIGDSLREAVRGGHGEIVNDLLENGGSAIYKDGRAPLHVAAREGNAEIVQMLLLTGARIDTLDDDKWTPLCTAVRCGRMAAVLALLAGGADVSVRCGALKVPVVNLAAKEANVDILRTLIEYGAGVEVSDVIGRTALHIATWKNNEEAVTALVEAGANIEAATLDGTTPLHFAAEAVSSQALAALLEHSAGVNTANTRNEHGRTPLYYAAANAGTLGAAEMVDLLLKSGADETIVDEDGNEAGGAIGRWVEEEHSLAKDVERVRKLLANAPADRAWRRRGYLVLCRARPDRLQQRHDVSNPHAGVEGRTRDGAKLARTQESNCDEAVCSSMVVEGTGGNWVGAVARVLELQEEGVFRAIMGYL